MKTLARTASTFSRSLPVIGLLLIPALAQAHPEGAGASGLGAGLHHPFSGLDHLLAMLAVGLWAAQLGRAARWALPIAFPAVMAVGACLGMLGVSLPGVEIGIALSALVLGALVLTEFRPPVWMASSIVGLFALFHGHAHGMELPANAGAVEYGVGFLAATAALHLIGMAVGSVHQWPVGRALVRVSGVAVAICGALFLWQAAG
jgi:urease accessory protein